ncbi:hypothetical protein ATDW_35050 (plasmid) [Asticcacaulis sp. DW145]|uniref:RcnB family protein n=1 Tax=Asticcacaulis sp. DW145 TaxID=3095608 RepID=UPI00308C2F67|nr:hypothetical protein ATDW_35050 [Asticcacaulis sp. DW145]
MKYALTLALAAATSLAAPALSKPPPQVPGAPDTHAQGGQAARHGPWLKGDKVPDVYQKSPYTVADWQRRNLATPARGSHWVRNDSHQFGLITENGTVSEVVSQNDDRYSRRWAHGDRLPLAFRRGDYIVTGWQARHLKPPKRGYRWIHVDNQYLLIDKASGRITKVTSDGQ